MPKRLNARRASDTCGNRAFCNQTVTIVDTHIHVLGADRAKYPRQLHAVIPPRFAWTAEDYTAENLLADMDRCGLGKALLVQAQNAYRSDNRYVADMATQYPDRFKAVCVVDAREADAADQLERWVGERGAVGGRMMFQTPDFFHWPSRILFAPIMAGGARGCGRITARSAP